MAACTWLIPDLPRKIRKGFKKAGKPCEPSLSASEYASGGEVIFVNVIHDIVIGWSHIHGLAHLKLERQLTMVPEDMHEALLVKASRRLATMLRQEAGNT